MSDSDDNYAGDWCKKTASCECLAYVTFVLFPFPSSLLSPLLFFPLSRMIKKKRNYVHLTTKRTMCYSNFRKVKSKCSISAKNKAKTRMTINKSEEIVYAVSSARRNLTPHPSPLWKFPQKQVPHPGACQTKECAHWNKQRVSILEISIEEPAH